MSVKIHPCLVCLTPTRNRVTCSKECSSKRFEKELVDCKECGKTIPKNFKDIKFCSRSCAATFNNKGVSRNTLGKGGFTEGVPTGRGNNGGGRVKILNHCRRCSREISITNVYCSRKCSAMYRKESNVASWLADDTIHNGKSVLPKHVRDYLLAEAGYRCTVSSCGWGEVNQFTGRVPLEVDHVDGDAHNNSKDNLRVVCPQCHALSPFHRALNRKSSRVDRGRSSK